MSTRLALSVDNPPRCATANRVTWLQTKALCLQLQALMTCGLQTDTPADKKARPPVRKAGNGAACSGLGCHFVRVFEGNGAQLDALPDLRQVKPEVDDDLDA